MRIIKKDYKKGFVKLRIQTLDDLWYLSKIILTDNEVSGITFRKISVGDKEGERKRVWLKIKVEKIEFRDFTNVLKLLGPIVESRDDRVPLGNHHSFNLSVSDEISINKNWSSVDKNYIKRSENSKPSDLLIVSCDYGDAVFANYHDYGIEYSGSLSEEIGGKKELKSYEKNKQAFLKLLMSTIDDVSKRNNIKKVLIGGASMITDNLKKLVKDYSYIKDKIFFAKINYSGKNGIKELIRKGEVDKLVQNNIYSDHVKIVSKVLSLIAKSGKVTYGLKQVSNAISQGAVSDLILTDNFIKNNRSKVEKLIQNSEHSKAKLFIIPSSTEHGEQIDNLTGITAILRYKLEK